MSEFQLSKVPSGAARERFLPLLLLADESEQQVRSYMQQGDLYIYSRGESGPVVGIVLALPAGPDVIELKAVAIEPQQQARGIGTQMLAAVLHELRAHGFRQAIVGTANAAIGQLAYYQKAGFRLLRIDRDYFSPARGYPETMMENGIRLRDMVWMEQSLDR